MAAIAGLLVGAPAFAKSGKNGPPKVSCKQINAAMTSGKTADDVATDLKVSPERVKSCGSHPAAKHHYPHQKQKPAS
jgi:hypothetical protein